MHQHTLLSRAALVINFPTFHCTPQGRNGGSPSNWFQDRQQNPLTVYYRNSLDSEQPMAGSLPWLYSVKPGKDSNSSVGFQEAVTVLNKATLQQDCIYTETHSSLLVFVEAQNRCSYYLYCYFETDEARCGLNGTLIWICIPKAIKTRAGGQTMHTIIARTKVNTRACQTKI